MSNFEKAKQRGESVDPALGVAAPNRVTPTDTLGAPGTAIYGGYLVTREKDPELTGIKRYETFSNVLANTSIVAAGVRFFLGMVAKARWSVEPADESQAAQDMADMVDEIMHDMGTPWHRVIRRAASYILYGFSVQEWTAKRRDDGVIGLLDIEPRAQITIEQWDLDEAGTVLGVIQTDPQDGKRIYIPREKLIYVVDDSLNDSPEGLGLLRHVVKVTDRLERYELLEGWGYETDLRGVPIARGPWADLEARVQAGTLSRAQVNQLKQPFIDFVDSHNKNPSLGMILDSRTYQTTDERSSPSNVRQWDVDLLQGSPTSAGDMHVAIERMNREIARVFGVEHLLLGGDAGGAYALSKDKSQSFGMLVDSCLKELNATFQRDVIDTLWELNGWPEELKPSYTIEQAQFRDLDVLGGLLEQLARAGAPLAPDDPAINELREQAGLSNAPEMDLMDPDLTLGGQQPEAEMPDDDEAEA